MILDKSSKNTPKKRRPPIFYGWFLVFLCVGNITVGYGVGYAFSVIFVSLLSEFGISRSALSGIFSLYILVFFSGGALVGPLLDRFGPRVVIPAGSLLIGLGLLACSLISSPYQLYITYGLITSMGVSSVSWLPNAAIITSWFVRRRGTVVGIVMCGSGLGLMLFTPLTQYMIETIGWRGAFLIIALINMAWLAPLNAIFQRARPEDLGLAPDGDAPAAISNPEEQRISQRGPGRVWTLTDALRHRSFWMMGLATFCNPYATYAIVLHQVALFVGRGFEPMYVTSVLGLIGIAVTIGRLTGGALSDRIERELAYTIFLSFMLIAVIFLFFMNRQHLWILPVYVISLGLGMGVGGSMFPAMLADLFQGPSLGRIMGLSSVFGGVGAAFGSWFTGYLYDRSGDYAWGLILILMNIVLAVVFVWMAAPRKAKKYLEALAGAQGLAKAQSDSHS